MHNLLPVTLGNIGAGSVSGRGQGRGGAGSTPCMGACVPLAGPVHPPPAQGLCHLALPLQNTNTRTHLSLPPSHCLQLCMATVYSLLYGSLGRKVTGEAKTA